MKAQASDRQAPCAWLRFPVGVRRWFPSTGQPQPRKDLLLNRVGVASYIHVSWW